MRLHSPDVALGMARVKHCWLVLRLKFKYEEEFFCLFLWSEEEIVTQHAAVKNFLLNSEAAELEKLRSGGVSHKKACLSRTNACC